jgi:hypothetical protein
LEKIKTALTHTPSVSLCFTREQELRRDEKIVAWKTRRKLGKTAVENENDLHFDKKKGGP